MQQPVPPQPEATYRETTPPQQQPSPVQQPIYPEAEPQTAQQQDPERLNPLAYLSQNKSEEEPAEEETTAITEGEEDEEPSRRSRKKKHKKKSKENAEKREKKRRKQFQEKANIDGYYNDRDTVDDLDEFEGERNIQWIPLILGSIGIIIFAVIFIQIHAMLG